MVTGAIIPPRGFINTDLKDEISRLRIGEKMIDADAMVFHPP